MGRKSLRGAQPISQILGELVARRGLARLRGLEELEAAWAGAVARVAGAAAAGSTRVAGLRGGVLEVLVSNSVLMQELAGFLRQQLVEALRGEPATGSVRDIRFRLEGGEG